MLTFGTSVTRAHWACAGEAVPRRTAAMATIGTLLMEVALRDELGGPERRRITQGKGQGTGIGDAPANCARDGRSHALTHGKSTPEAGRPPAALTGNRHSVDGAVRSPRRRIQLSRARRPKDEDHFPFTLAHWMHQPIQTSNTTERVM